MRRKIAVLSFLIILSLLVTSCSKSSTQTTKNNDAGKDNKVYTLKLNVHYPKPTYKDETKYIACDIFAKRVEEETKGRVKIEVYYNNQLAPQNQGLDALKKGIIDMDATTSYWGGVVPESDLVWLPYGFIGIEHALHVMRETDIGKIFEKAYEKQGAKVLFYWSVQPTPIISKKAIRTLDDFKGLKMRVGSSLWTDWYKSLGIAPVNIAVAEVYEALMRGTIDIHTSTFSQIDTYKLYEVAKYVTVPPILDPILCYHLVNIEKWNSLPDDLKQIIEKVSRDIEKEHISYDEKMVGQTIKIMNEKNVELVKFDKNEYEKYKQSAMIVWDKFAARSPECAEMVKILKDNQEQWFGKHPESKEWAKKWLRE